MKFSDVIEATGWSYKSRTKGIWNVWDHSHILNSQQLLHWIGCVRRRICIVYQPLWLRIKFPNFSANDFPRRCKTSHSNAGNRVTNSCSTWFSEQKRSPSHPSHSTWLDLLSSVLMFGYWIVAINRGYASSFYRAVLSSFRQNLRKCLIDSNQQLENRGW